jgi:acyl-CoA thioesterase FadM
VWPGDIDVLFHVNNGVYLSMLDVARVDMMLRSRALGPLRRARVYPIVHAQTIRYRRSLRLFERFDVETRVAGWDDQAFLLTHGFLRGEELVAEAVVRVRFLRRGGAKPTPGEVLELLDLTGQSPALPESMAVWNAAQRGSR